MKISAVTIFPEYFQPLSLSLIGKALDSGLVDLQIKDLREFTHDNHRTVDDTPYGGGAGMVMKPEPWGEALDETLTDDCDLIILTPAGKRFTQELAEKFASAKHLVFACGRYEGIDARVTEYYGKKYRTHEISIGDFVLAGGEVAALAIIESVLRLIPGVLGNPESLIEESHVEVGQVEYPSYTKPFEWRGLKVPEVLTSGNHGEIAKWRSEAARTRSIGVDREPTLP